MDERKHLKGFYESVRRTFIVCRMVGYLPITGLTNKESKFSSAPPLARGLVLQVFAILSSMFLIRFSITWRDMIKKIEDIEKVLPSFQNPQRIFKNINRIMLSLLLFGLVDHFIHLIVTVRMTSLCYNSGEGISFKSYYAFYYIWVFEHINFNYGIAFLLQLTTFQTVFVYYFVDALVTVVTLYLVYRFRNFNRLMRIRQIQCAKNRRIPWMDLQAHYTRLTRLVKIIDDYINPFVFMTFLSNLVVVCKHIYDIIQRQKAVSMNSYNPNCGIAKSSDWIVVVDSIISTLHLIFRTTLVSTFTAHLHTLSREPLRALHTLPASAYNLEVQRFMDQVYHSKIHLSGLGYFYVTRVTVLSMLSTIVTYELVLLQLPVYYY
nr:gustatory receptor for sugar taste 64f-like [Vanessa tameamea]